MLVQENRGRADSNRVRQAGRDGSVKRMASGRMNKFLPGALPPAAGFKELRTQAHAFAATLAMPVRVRQVSELAEIGLDAACHRPETSCLHCCLCILARHTRHTKLRDVDERQKRGMLVQAIEHQAQARKNRAAAKGARLI